MNDQSLNLNAQQSCEDVADLVAHLRVVRSRVRLILVFRSVLASFSILSLVLIGLVFIDYFLRLPMGVRLITLGAMVYITGWCWVRIIKPALSVVLTETDVALKIEHQDPSLRGLVASAADLDRQVNDQNTDPITTELATAALDAVRSRLSDRLTLSKDSRVYPSIINLRDITHAALLCGLIILGVGAMNFQSPELVSIGATRALAPWSETRWPMRFAIVDVTETTTRPIDIAVPIRSHIGTTQHKESNARATVSWRLFVSEEGQPGAAINDWTQTLLIAQHAHDESRPPIYEQLIDAQSVASTIDSDSFVLEYKIETRDDESSTQQILLVRPPKLLETTLEVSVPAYAQQIIASNLVQTGLTAISAYDAVVSPILAESRVEIIWHFSKPIELPEHTTPDWISSIASTNTIVGFDQPTPNTIRLELIAHDSVRIEPGVVDTSGIPVRKPIALSLGVLDDLGPIATITEPVRDETVSSHALIDLAAELSDDFGLKAGVLRANIAKVPGESSGAPHEPIDDGVVLIRTDFAASLREQLTYSLDLGTLSPTPGDQIWITSTAWDIQSSNSSNSDAIGMNESPVRVLRVVEDLELIEQIRNGLGPIHHAMRQLDQQQALLQEQLRDGASGTGKDQRSLTHRLRANKQAIEQLDTLRTRNRLDDAPLESLLEDAGSILDEAISAGENASDQLDRGQNERASENQRLVRDRIGEFVAMLDRGQDSWLALRSIQKLRDELEAIRDDTAKLTAQTAGKSLDQLTAEQQSALDRIMERQIASAEDAHDAMSTLDEHAQQLEEHDPTQAEALRKAARQGRSAQIEQRLKEASEQIESNQTSAAAQSQTEVLEDLDEMLEELEHMIKNRDNALRRELATIIESIEALIKSQETQIKHINEASADAGMIVLVGNTLAVRDDALGAFPETRSIADLITQAANAQTNAINALRQSPSSIDEADRHERSSLLNLNSALEEAKRLDDQAADRQARQLRTELRDSYREALEIQTALRDETKLMVGEPLNRRQRANARAIGLAQSDLQRQMSELLEQTQELGDAPVFTLAHTQLDRSMTRIVDGLGGREIEQRVINLHTSSIVILSTLVEVLSDESPAQDSDDFDDGSQGGSSSGSGTGGDEPVIPPVAQLKLLRSMQQLAAMQTREYSENPELANETDIESLADLQRQLFEHGRKLIEELSNNNRPTPQEPSSEPIEPEEGLIEP